MSSKIDLNKNDQHVISYLALRKSIGVIGIGLPPVLVVGKLLIDWVCKTCADYRSPVVEGTTQAQQLGQIIQSSISSYYWTSVGDIFVGGLCAIGIFLLAYKGEKPRDDSAGNLACFFAVGVALFPTTKIGIDMPNVVGISHYVFAAGLFVTLAYFCLVIFQEDDIGPSDNLKPARNKVYYTCGIVIVGCLAGILIVNLLDWLEIKIPPILAPVFWFEAIAIWAFGWSWFVKGKGLNILRTASAEK